MPDILQLHYKILALKNEPWWWRVAYLIIDIFRQHPELENGFDRVAVGKDDGFNKFVTAQVQQYMEKGVAPAAGIAGAVINIAEDVAAGRQPTMRAGDYIALQTAYRAAGR
ncbi:MAG TPA: hypothetical protein VMJ75_31075 [Candidatus Acidoferrales bacterium]|nr:hypothetical protein [Candidatus Acidoferrales bacterium]HXK04721.1 hypothetical protein [Verrucomicrobiae bacterium]